MSDPKPLAATILNVDDNEATLYVRTRALQRAGFQVIEADRGSKVIPLVATYQPDLVLLDVNLPDANGYDICREIKNDPAYQSIIVVQTSALSIDGNDRLQGFAAGADSYFLEPMEPEELVANVSALLRLRRMERDLRRSAIEWQKTFDAVHDGVAIVQDDGSISRSNAAFERLTGATASQRIQDVLHIDFRPADETVNFDVVLGDRALRLSIDPVIDHLGQATHFACILTDVTAEREIAALNERLTSSVEHLRRANEIADSASRAKDEFLATLSHELRTPMTSIVGWAQMLRIFGSSPENVDEASNAILASARAQSQLVEDLLDLSRITTGKLRLRTEAMDLAEVVDAAVQIIVPAAAAKRIDIEKHIEHTNVFGDRNRLQQVIWNLLSNAVKFTPDRGRIEIRVEVNGTRAAITVRDSGKGIEPSFLPAVFDRFSQAESVAGRSTGGLGLGLAIVRSIVELHGGEVTAESPGPGMGSTFRVMLPVTDAQPLGDSAASELPDLEGRRILLVDDSGDARTMFSAFFRAAGATVYPAASASEARAIDAAEKIDVVVTDISMPGETGLDLIRTMRDADKERVIIAMTALGSGVRDAVMAAGATAMLEKPFGIADLVRMLAE